MRRAMPPKPTSLPSEFSRLTFASGGTLTTIFLPSSPSKIARRTASGSFSHGVSREKRSAFERLNIIRPSQVSGLYLKASRTKHPPAMLRRGSGTRSSGCVSLWTPRPPHVRQALSGLFEHEVLRLDIAINEVMRFAAQPAVEPLHVCLARPLEDVYLEQPIANKQRGGDSGLDGFFMLAADHKAVHHSVHVLDLRIVELHFRRYVHR